MAIVDYQERARASRANALADPSITDRNKEHLRAHAKQYDLRVSAARQHIFYQAIRRFLRHSKDLAEEMHDRAVMNAMAARVRGECPSESTYATALSTVQTFARWLNDGDKPKGMRDLIGPTKRKLKRALRREDMTPWDEGLAIAKQDKSVQMQALLLTQLDGGFRPSELIDLNYGDLESKGRFIIARVNGGKTGAREVVLYRCVPHLSRWLNAHPMKKKGSPLWLMENVKQSHRKHGSVGSRERYSYAAVVKRIKGMFASAGIDRPCDLYSLRHSAAFQKKLDNVPVEEAAAGLGHTVKHFVETYGRLDVNDRTQRIAKAYGFAEQNAPVSAQPVLCGRCEASNDASADLCERCGSPLRLDVALKKHASVEEEIAELRAIVNAIRDKQVSGHRV